MADAISLVDLAPRAPSRLAQEGSPTESKATISAPPQDTPPVTSIHSSSNVSDRSYHDTPERIEVWNPISGYTFVDIDDYALREAVDRAPTLAESVEDDDGAQAYTARAKRKLLLALGDALSNLSLLSI
jgi:hypothetical protein